MIEYLIIISTAILGILELFKSDKHFKCIKIIRITLIVIIAGLGLILAHNSYINKEYSENVGRLYGGKIERNEISCLRAGNSEFPIQSTLNILDSNFSIWIENNQLMVSTSIKKDDDVIVKIDKNIWNVNGELRDSLKIDRNFDHNALEIVDENGKVIFQVIYEGKCVSLSGIFYQKEGNQIAIFPLGDRIIIRKGESGDDMGIIAEPLFKYPSDLYPGKRASLGGL